MVSARCVRVCADECPAPRKPPYSFCLVNAELDIATVWPELSRALQVRVAAQLQQDKVRRAATLGS